MKKEVTLQSVPTTPCSVWDVVLGLCRSLKHKVLTGKPLCVMAQFYSRLLETSITPLQALLLTYAQVVFWLMVFPYPFAIVTRVVFILWFAVALLQCRKNGVR